MKRVSKWVVIWDKSRLLLNMLRRGGPEHASSVQNLRRRFAPTQVSVLPRTWAGAEANVAFGKGSLKYVDALL